jgi:hypothetical protein
MFYLLLISIGLFSFLAFMALTLAEARTGVRILGRSRAQLDQQIERASFIVGHVNWSDFLSHLVQSIVARIAHDIAHWSLIVVRFIERQLTRIVRYLRDRRPNVLAPKPSRVSPLTQTVQYLRKTLRLPKKQQE